MDARANCGRSGGRLVGAACAVLYGLVGAPKTHAAQENEGAPAALPNIVVVYADDLGYGDLSCYNPRAAYRTPNIDRLAREGLRFTDAHSPCTICSPSRYGLYTGNLVCRTGRRPVAFEGPAGPSYIRPGELTIGAMLRSRGYRTAVFGKWHVGLTWFDAQGRRLRGGFRDALLIDYDRSTPLIDGPNARGFDVSFVTPNCPTTDPLYVYIENGRVPVPASRRHRRETLPNPGGKWRWDNDEGWMAPGYRFVDADLLFFEKTEQFLRDHRRRYPERPFFVVLSTQISHAPVLPAPEFRGLTEAGPRGDFVRELDELVGRLMALLRELGVDRHTLVVFNSDNGPETLHTVWMRQDYGHDPAGGWRGMKRDGWEGGHRIPLIVWWPEAIPGGRVSSQMTNTTDLMATLASLVGYPLPDAAAVDSFDMLPVWLGVQSEDEPVRPYMLTQSFRGEFQLRVGSWKYLAHRGSGGNDYSKGPLKVYAVSESAPGAPAQLYDLNSDPGERNNLYFEQPERVERMRRLLRAVSAIDGRTAPRNRQPLGPEGVRRLLRGRARVTAR